ncbi:MAG: ATP-binding protein [bacterium]
MSFLLEKKLEHESLCESDIRAGRVGNAVFHAAKAAEFAYALAAQTAGNIGQRYIEDAEGWLEIAERLRTRPPVSRKTEDGGRKTEGKGQRTKDDEQGPDDDWLVTEKPNVTFDMIAGMAEAKQSIMEMVVLPLKSPEKAKALGLRAGGGVLLYGPPGNGKTLLGKAVASQLDAPFYYASGAQIRSKWHGESEQRLRKLIQSAKQQSVAVLFLDEVDGLLPKRGGNSVVDNRLVTQFLAEIGGFEESDNVLLVLGATNKPWEIDEAVFRTGRFDEKIYVGLPDDPARLGILHMHLDKVPLGPDFDFEKWAKRIEGYTGSDIVGVVNDAKRSALSRSIREEGDPQLTNADLEAAFKTIPSSVTPQLLQRYEQFKQARFGQPKDVA